MNTIEHNLEKEKRLVELLGYSIVGPDGSNRWLIVDENQNQVGYIQYKKLHNGNSKKGYVKVFGYHTFIDSPSISCEFSRRLNDKEGNIHDSIDGYYVFDIKRDNRETDHVEMNIRNYLLLNIWSKEYGFIDFHIDFKGLYLNFKSKTDNFNIEEVLIYKNVDNEYHYDKEYMYQISYCNKAHELSDDKYRTTRVINGIQHYYDEKKLRIYERKWVGGKLRTYKDSVVEGTVEEMATKHQMGIDCFNHFRYLLNKIIPFNDDVVSLIVSDDNIKEGNLGIFFQDNEKEEELRKKLK